MFIVPLTSFYFCFEKWSVNYSNDEQMKVIKRRKLEQGAAYILYIKHLFNIGRASSVQQLLVQKKLLRFNTQGDIVMVWIVTTYVYAYQYMYMYREIIGYC